jgi:antitoxin (DNA-binding transcriptional repressor) of toxin-antitoxin stability system
MTKTLSIEQIAQSFDSVLDSVAEYGEDVRVERGGRVVALLVQAGKEWDSPSWTKKVSAAEFKQNCVEFIDAVVSGGGMVLVEKEAKVVARLLAAGPMFEEDDLLSPVVDPDDWTADEDNLFGTERP